MLITPSESWTIDWAPWLSWECLFWSLVLGGPLSHLFSFLDVIVFSDVGPSNKHDGELLIVPGAQRGDTLHID